MGEKFLLPTSLKPLVLARNTLKERYKNSGLSFTFDGNLVGDLGEAVACEMFGIKLENRNVAGIDGRAEDGRTVQVKASGTFRGPAFRPINAHADHLLFFHFDYDECSAEVIYNGPESKVLALLPENWREKKHQRMVSLKKIRDLDNRLLPSERLKIMRNNK